MEGAVGQASPHCTLKDLQSQQSSMCYSCICANQHYIGSASLFHLLSLFAVPRREQL